MFILWTFRIDFLVFLKYCRLSGQFLSVSDVQFFIEICQGVDETPSLEDQCMVGTETSPSYQRQISLRKLT